MSLPPPPFYCPIAPDVAAIVEHSSNLRRALQKLRRDLAACRLCERGPKCSSWVSLEQAVQQAIHEVAQEWRP
jgi:hypothetical protein